MSLDEQRKTLKIISITKNLEGHRETEKRVSSQNKNEFRGDDEILCEGGKRASEEREIPVY